MGRPDGPALPRRECMINFTSTQILHCEARGNERTLKLKKKGEPAVRGSLTVCPNERGY